MTEHKTDMNMAEIDKLKKKLRSTFTTEHKTEYGYT